MWDGCLGLPMNATSTANASISDPEFLLSLREDVAGLPHSGAKEFLDFLRVMWSEGATETGLRSRFGPGAPISQWLSELARKGWICYSAVSDGRRLATFIPTSSQTAFDPLIRLSGGPQALSRFVLMRRDDRNLVLESPLSASKVLLHDADAIALAVAFMTPTCAADVLSRARLRNADTEMVLSILANAGAIVPVDVAGREQAPVGSDDWEVHDLFFHSRSRAGRHVNRYGRRRPSGGKPEHLEAQGEPSNGISLYAPDIDVLKTTDPPFAKVVEERRSIRPAASAAALGLRQLGEFLYRAARWKSDGRRPYPGAGSCYELELYLAVRQCIGLEPGFYRYDAAAHRLCRLTEVTPASVELLEE